MVCPSPLGPSGDAISIPRSSVRHEPKLQCHEHAAIVRVAWSWNLRIFGLRRVLPDCFPAFADTSTARWLCRQQSAVRNLPCHDTATGTRTRVNLSPSATHRVTFSLLPTPSEKELEEMTRLPYFVNRFLLVAGCVSEKAVCYCCFFFKKNSVI